MERPGQVPRLLGGPGSARVVAAGGEQDAAAGQLQPGKETVNKVTNCAAGQLGITAVAPGSGDHHGGAWAVNLVTFSSA